MVRGGFTLSAALLLAVFSLACVLWRTPLLPRADGPTELVSARSTSVTAAAISSKGHPISALPQRVQSLARQSKPARVVAALQEPELSSVARMTQLASEGDLSPTTQNEIDIIENNMNFLRDEMDKVSDQLTAEHDFMQVAQAVCQTIAPERGSNPLACLRCVLKKLQCTSPLKHPNSPTC